MKRVLVAFTMMTILFSQPAFALTRLTQSEMSGISAQFGILSTIGLSEMINLKNWAKYGKKVEFEDLGEGFGFAEGTRETRIEIRDAVIDIDRVEYDLFRTRTFSMGHITMSGIYLEIPEATISIWNH